MKSNKKTISIILIITLILALSACNKATQEVPYNEDINYIEDFASTVYPFIIVDSFNREVRIEQEPKKIISIAPNITETMFAIGAEDKLIGRTDFCDYPKESKHIESIGSIYNPSIEKIAELDPDLVIASTHFKKEILEKLEDLHIKVVVLYGSESFDGAYETIEKVSTIVNRREEGKLVIDDMKNTVEDVINRIKDLEKPSVYYVLSYGKGGDYTAGKGTFISQLIEMAGGENVASDVEGWKYSLESLIEKDPYILICSKYFDTKEGIEKANGYKDLTAVKEGRVFEIDNNLLDRQGPRLAEGLKDLAEIIHPSAFK